MTPKQVAFAALDGREVVGFLAALGVLRILTNQGVDARLSFDPVHAHAVLHGMDDIDDVVAVLAAVADAQADGSGYVGLPASFLAPRRAEGWSDPGRITPDEYRTLADSCGDVTAQQWLRSLWTDLALDDGGRCATSPFYAPTGRQTMRSMFETPAAAVREDSAARLHEAMAGWRRHDGFTGEMLDVRAVRGAAEQADGKPTMSGVPGATWLALSALPFFPMGGDGTTSRTKAWQRVTLDGGRRRRLVFGWPVWRNALDADAVSVLLGHSAVDAATRRACAASPGGIPDEQLRERLRALGVECVMAASRRRLPGGKSAGVLVSMARWS